MTTKKFYVRYTTSDGSTGSATLYASSHADVRNQIKATFGNDLRIDTIQESN